MFLRPVLCAWFRENMRPLTSAEEKFILADLVNITEGNIQYLYDLNCGWEHILKVENTDSPNPDRSHPIRCLAGAGACPPEDCGAAAFESLCDVLADKTHEDYPAMKKRYGKFDPGRFSTRSINRIFKITPSNRRNTPEEPALSEGMAEIVAAQEQAMRRAEIQFRAQDKTERF